MPDRVPEIMDCHNTEVKYWYMDTCTSFKLFSPMAQLYKKRRVGPKSNSTLDPKGIIKKCKGEKKKTSRKITTNTKRVGGTTWPSITWPCTKWEEHYQRHRSLNFSISHIVFITSPEVRKDCWQCSSCCAGSHCRQGLARWTLGWVS